MKRILNKILCFMWGHSYYLEYFWVNRPWYKKPYLYPDWTKFYKCKHCGAHKHG